jgi:hypothetical protein
MADDDDNVHEDDSNELFRELCGVTMELLVTFGLINSIIGQYPSHVREGLMERMMQLKQNIERETEIIQGFGEAFDEGPE